MVLVAHVTTREGELKVHSDKGKPTQVGTKLVFNDGSWVDYMTQKIHQVGGGYLAFTPPAGEVSQVVKPVIERQVYHNIDIVALTTMPLAKVEFVNHDQPYTIVEITGVPEDVKLVKCQPIGPELVVSQEPGSGSSSGPLIIVDTPNMSVSIGSIRIGGLVSAGSINIGGVTVSGHSQIDDLFQVSTPELVVKMYVPDSIKLHLEGEWRDVKIAKAYRVTLARTGDSAVKIREVATLILQGSDDNDGHVTVTKVTQSLTGAFCGSGGLTIQEMIGTVDVVLISDGKTTIEAGQITSLKLTTTGNGKVIVEAPVVGDATLDVNGMGNVNLGPVSGNLSIDHAGSGNLHMAGAVTKSLVLVHEDMGNVKLLSHFGTADILMSGMGNVTIQRVDRIIRQRNHGMGRLKIN